MEFSKGLPGCVMAWFDQAFASGSTSTLPVPDRQKPAQIPITSAGLTRNNRNQEYKGALEDKLLF